MSTAPHSSRARLFWIATVAATAAIVAAVLVPLSAQATPIAFSGVVTGPDGNPLVGVSITAYDTSPSLAPVGTPVVSSATGAFVFPSLMPDLYTLRFAATPTTFAQYLGAGLDDSNFDEINLADAAGDQAYVQATLLASGTLSGKVSKLPSGAVSGYTVRAYRQAQDGTWSIADSVTTSSTGAYTMTGLEPGSFRLEALDPTSAHPTYAPLYSGGGADLASASVVGITAAHTSTYNFSLGKAGSVAGTVTGLSGSMASKLAGVRVTAYRLAGTAPSFTGATAVESGTATTSTTGAYAIAGLAPGDYTLEFDPTSATPTATHGYGRSFLGNKDTAIGATVLHVGNGTALTGKNIQLVEGATVEGEIVEGETWPSSDDPVVNIRVTLAYVGANPDDPNEHAQSVLTDTNGDFTFSDVGPGNYDVWIGTNKDSSPIADTGHVRQTVPLANGTITPGENDFERFLSYFKNPAGFHATTAPLIDTEDGSNVGDDLLVEAPVWSISDGGPIAVSYQWTRGNKPIIGATNPDYVIQPGDANNDISVTAIGSNLGYGTSVASVSAPVTPGMGSQIPGTPEVTGDSRIGNTLTASPGTWSASGTTFEYQWQSSVNGSSGWADIGGAVSQTYLISAIDLPHPYLRVNIYATKPGYTDAQATSTSLIKVTDGVLTVTAEPVVSKGASAYAVSAGTWSPATYDTATVVWTVHNPNGTSTDFTQPTLPLTTAGTNYVSVDVTHAKVGYPTTGTGALLVQTGILPTSSGSTSITSAASPKVGLTLTAPTPTWLPSGGTSTWQWQYKSGSSWKNLTGTASTYTPVAADLGRVLRVVITQHTPGYPNATLTSGTAPSIAIGDPAHLQSGFGWTGTATTTHTVTVTPGTWSPTPTSYGYQWLYQPAGSTTWKKASGGTHAAFTIPRSLFGAELEINVTVKLTGHTSTPASLSLGTIGGTLAVVKPPKVTHVGNVYTASGATFSPAATGGVVYQWYSYSHADAPTIAFTGPTATLDPTLHYSVIAIGSRTGYSDSPGAQTLAKLGTFVPSGAITLTGGVVGSPITQSPITWLVTGPTLSYQWQYQSGSSWKSISKATAATYSPTSTYIGKHVRVTVTAKRANYTSLTVDSSPTTVTEATLAPGTGADAPLINGGIWVGSTITALPGTWNATGLSYKYVWAYSSDSGSTWNSILGATKASYVIPDAAYNTWLIRVTITASKANYLPGAGTAITPYEPSSGSFVRHTSPSVSKVGSELVASTGTWSPTPTSYEFDWEVFDPDTDSSTQVSTTNNYTPVAADAGKLIQVTLYPDLAHYNSGGIILNAQLGATITPTVTPTLTGNMNVGSTLMANWESGDFSTASPEVQAQWYRSGVAIKGQVNATYTLVSADYGKTITLKLTLSKEGYGTGSVVLSAGTIYNPVLPTASIAPAITGSGLVDATLTATSGTWNLAGLTFAYQWTRGGYDIPGATGTSYVPNELDVGQELGVTVTASKATYQTVSASSETTTAQSGTPIANTAPTITITGDAQLGQPLSLSAATWNFPVTVKYQWQWRPTSVAIWTDITGADSNTYTPSATDGLTATSQVRVLVNAYRGGHPNYFNYTDALQLF